MVQGGELPGYFVGFVEGGVDRAGEPDPVSDRGKSGQYGEGVRTSDHVEVVDLAALLTKPEPLGEKEEVELRPFGRSGQFHERCELDVTSGVRIAPHGGVVHTGEVCSEMDLSRAFRHRGASSSRLVLGPNVTCVRSGSPGGGAPGGPVAWRRRNGRENPVCPATCRPLRA